MVKMVNMLVALIITARPRQWSKNLVVLLPFFFSAGELWRLTDLQESSVKILMSCIAVLVFCTLSSAGYVLNDLIDAKLDRQHPVKRNRPIASGIVGVSQAVAFAAILMLVGQGIALYIHLEFGLVAAIYLVLAILYSAILKAVVLLDVFAISACFILRAVAGAAILSIPVSPWLYACLGFGALFIALIKRRSELVSSGKTAKNQRVALAVYTEHLLDQFILVAVTATTLTYLLYTFTATNLPDSDVMMLTVPFVIYGVFRYMYLVYSSGLGESPVDVIMKDFPLLATIVLWIAISIGVLSMAR